jgi:hypothetical protein
MSLNGAKKAIMKKAVKSCGKGGPGWDAIKSVASKAEKFVKGRIGAMKKINQDRAASYYRPATPAQINVLKGYGKIKDGSGGPGTASWRGIGNGGDNVPMGDLTKRLSNVKFKTK